MPLPAVFDLATLNGLNGYVVATQQAGDQVGAVQLIGDINNDGIADYFHTRMGTFSYVVFGSQGPQPAVLDPRQLDGTNGFRLEGPASPSDKVVVAAAAGDFNGDGLQDVLLGAEAASGSVGLAYIVYGRDGDFPAAVNYLTMTEQQGVKLTGPTAGQPRFGWTLSSIGDFNGDGFDDVAVGAPLFAAGSAYIYFGSASPGAALSGSDAVVLTGLSSMEFFGVNVTSWGDLNGDGLAELVIYASAGDRPGGANVGVTYVVFGTPDPSSVDLTALDGTDGFRLLGASGRWLSDVVPADFNGDGRLDLAMTFGQSSPERQTFVLLGREGGFAADIDLGALAPEDGYWVRTTAGGVRSLGAVAAGDVNGDGYDDLVVSVQGADLGVQNGPDGVYVIYGKAGADRPDLDLAQFTGSDGVRMQSQDIAGFLGGWGAVADVNDDGLGDILLSAGRADLGAADSGGVYVVYGQSSTSATTGADAWQGTAGIDKFKTLGGDDTLRGLGGNDILDGGPGTDKSLYVASAKDYAWWQVQDGSWRVQDLRPNSPEGADTLLSIEQLGFSDRTIKIAGASNAELLTLAFEQVMRIAAPTGDNQTFLNGLVTAVNGSTKTLAQAYGEIAQRADGTTAVAAMTYQFFLGFAPSKGGFDYLVSPTGPNPNNINSAYFQFFSQENRYINFAVSVGSLGDGKAPFTAEYGSLTLRQATAKAYQEIFGGSAPNESFLNLLLDADVGNGMTRKDYFAYYGGDGLQGLGTKAAMVGWLLTEAAKADVGVYARSNNAYLQDLADGAQFLVDMVGVYSQPDWGHNAPG